MSRQSAREGKCSESYDINYYISFVRRQVDSKDGEKLSKEMDCAWTETSAKENIHISECAPVFSWNRLFDFCPFITGKVFELCLQEIERNTAPNQEEPPAKSCTMQ